MVCPVLYLWIIGNLLCLLAHDEDCACLFKGRTRCCKRTALMGAWHRRRLRSSFDRALSNHCSRRCFVCGACPFVGALWRQSHAGATCTFPPGSLYSFCRRISNPTRPIWAVVGIDRPVPNANGDYRYRRRYHCDENHFPDFLYRHGSVAWLAFTAAITAL